MAIVQSSYSINPEAGFPGGIARPTEPWSMDGGVIHVPSGAARKPRPGDAVYYDQAENAFALPTDAAQSLLTVGILSYRADTVQTAADLVEYKDGDAVQVGVLGTYWVTADEEVEYDDLLVWDRASPYRWNVATKPADFAGLYRLPIVCVSRKAVAAGKVAEARIGFGRVI